MSKELTLADVKSAMPLRKGAITQEAVDIINASQNDPEFQGESLVQTAGIYESVLKGARASVPEYLNAIRFCAYMSTNDSNYTEAYKKVFSNRDFVQQRMHLPTNDPRYGELTSAASRYRRTKLVTDILTASQVPLDLIFTGHRYKAIGVLAEVMESGKYDRDRINAAKELLAATKGPDNMKIELDVGVSESSAVQQLNDQLAEIAGRSLKHLEAGSTNLKELGAMKVTSDDILEGEFKQND
jgi:hypothetical protein